MSFKESIDLLYKIHKNDKVVYHFEEYFVNGIIVFIACVFIFVFYVRINVQIDKKNWTLQKCNPKYLFFSGYIHNDTNLSDHDATISNFVDCANEMKKGTNEYMVGSLIEKTTNYFTDAIDNSKKKAKSYHNKVKKKTKKQEKKMSKQVNSQYDSLENNVSFNIDASGAYSYNLLKNVGIYIDQLNAIMDYIGDYIKQFLTYRMMDYANQCISSGNSCTEDTESYKKAIRIKNVLDTYYGSTSL